jgi:putative FmdB family regulatory protein
VVRLPIYQYKCDKCFCEFDIRKSFSDDSNHVTCPECGGKAERIFSPPGIIFKGSGFYVTDYKSNSTITSGDSKPKETKAPVEKTAADKTTKPAGGSK